MTQFIASVPLLKIEFAYSEMNNCLQGNLANGYRALQI